MEEETEYKIYHKIEPNRKIRVFKNTYKDKTYYRVQITQKNYDGTETKCYFPIQFKKGIELDNETDIKIHKAYENFRTNPKDEYHAIFYLLITEFEILPRQEQLQEQAFDKYQETLNENESEPIISDAQLPF